MSQQAAAVIRAYRGLVLGMHASVTTNAVIYRGEVTTVGWPHVRTDELGCLTAQKLDCVTSTMCWCIVLLEDKHVPSNAADRWQQLLRQQHLSIVLSK